MTGAQTFSQLTADPTAAVHLAASPLGGPVVRLQSPAGIAEVALQGAQLVAWVPAGFEPVIWMSPVERLGTAKAVRGGSPICWPWFASHPSDASKPAHGFVRTRMWEVVQVERAASHLRVAFATRTTPADHDLWPHTASLQFDVTLGAGLDLALTTSNLGPTTFALTQALHTYFAVGDISAVTVDGFDAETYLDKLDGNARKTQSGAIRFDREVDRVYDQHAGRSVICDAKFNRRISIAQRGSRSAVVWNPWIDKCARLGDMGPDGYRGMVCIETTNAGTDIVTLAPGASHTLGASYAVSRPA